MSLTVNASGGGEDFPKLEPGKYEGTCFRIVDLGTSEQEYKGQVSKKKRIRLDFADKCTSTFNIKFICYVFNRWW